MGKGYFNTLPPEQRKLISQKGGQSRRSDAIDRAWGNKAELRQRYQEGESVKDLAREAGITERTMFRIVRGK